MTFPAGEYRDRTRRAQGLMTEAGLSALLLTLEADVRYFTGFLTRFWESPTRPWFVIVPAKGDAIAVIPQIGAHLMGQGWIRDIRTWEAPDYDDDGVRLLADTLREVTSKGAQIGLPHGLESHLRMPLADFAALKAALAPRAMVSDGGLVRDLRMIKSDAEIAMIETAAGIANRAFDRVPEMARVGVPLSEVFRRFQMLCLDEGADYVPYLAGAAGPDGYADVISPADDRPLAEGDVLMLDTGLVRQGYFCDFDRNYALGPPSDRVQTAHATLIHATQAAFDIARPGARISDLYHAMVAVTGTGTGTGTGRLGHGLGMQLTEGVSILANDHTELAPGMVLTLEPWVPTRDDLLMVHEENIVIEAGGARWLSAAQDATMRVL